MIPTPLAREASVGSVSAPLTREMRAGAELVWTLVRTDFKARYHGSLNGFLWALLKPALMFVVLMTVFSFIFPDPGYKLNLIVGLCLWEFFADATKTGLIALDAKAFLIKKVRAPLWVLVLSSLANALLTLTVTSMAIVVFLATNGRMPSIANLTCFFVYELALVAIVCAFALAGSVVFLRVRDLNQVWDVVLQAGFFLAPVMYPLGIIPERFHFYFYLWPPTPIVEFSRAVLVTGMTPTPTAHAYLILEVVAFLAIGVLVFRRFAPRAPEYV